MKINNDFVLRDVGASNTQNEFHKGRFSWYYFKESFSPQLFDHAISQMRMHENDLIIDPFNGSGTVTLAASKHKIKSLGIEVNPFAAFLSSTKLANIENVERLNKSIDQTKNSIYRCKEFSPLIGFSTFSKSNKNEKWLFNDTVLNSFYSGFKKAVSFEDKNVRNVIKLSLIASAMENCNAFQDGKCLKYKPEWRNLKYNKKDFLNSFESRINQIVLDLINEPIINSYSKIVNADCREILKTVNKENKFKLCITSPPYLNSFDYTDVYRPELFLGNFIKSQKSLFELRKRTVRSHVNVREDELLNTDFGLLHRETINKMKFDLRNPWQKKIPVMIQAYFEDMNLILRKLRSHALPNAELWLTVSNSAYNGVEIPVDLILANIGTSVGWYLSEIGVLRYIPKRGTKYSPEISHLRESVVIFKGNK